MTEAEWLSCSDPQPMLSHLGSEADARKLLLFCVAAVRSVASDSREVQVRLEVAERYADGKVGTDEVRRWWGEHLPWPENPRAWAVKVAEGVSYLEGHPTPSPVLQAELLRDIFGDPFRSASFDPAWRAAEVMSLAEAVSGRHFTDVGR